MEVTLLDYMGDDLRVVNAARVSFAKEHDKFTLRKDVPKGSDEGLLQYLAEHNHWTPFSHPQITMREKVPIFVARQRFKHMVGFTYNEISRRYVDSDPEFYTPSKWRSRPEENKKQGSGNKEVTHLVWGPDAGDITTSIHDEYTDLIDHVTYLYKSMIDNGVAPEQARMILPQSMYTEYYVTGSLAAWARAYKQRKDEHAQIEIQELASKWDEILQTIFPYSWKVLTS